MITKLDALPLVVQNNAQRGSPVLSSSEPESSSKSRPMSSSESIWSSSHDAIMRSKGWPFSSTNPYDRKFSRYIRSNRKRVFFRTRGLRNKEDSLKELNEYREDPCRAGWFEIFFRIRAKVEVLQSVLWMSEELWDSCNRNWAKYFAFNLMMLFDFPLLVNSSSSKPTISNLKGALPKFNVTGLSYFVNHT